MTARTLHRLSLLLALFAVLFAALFAAPAQAARGARAAAAEPLRWPAPPETARIEYVRELRGPRDVGASESALRKTLMALAGAKRSESVNLSRPTDVYADADGKLYVSDAAAGRVYVFDTERHTVTPWVGKGAGRLGRPMGLGGDGAGRVVVTDPVNRRALVFDRDGVLQSALGGPGQLINPVDATLDAGGRVFVADSYLHQIVVFSPDGKILQRIGKTLGDASGKAGEAPPVDDGNVWSQRSATSKDIRENRGGGPGEFLYPLSVAWNESLGLLAVVDGLNARVQLFDRGLVYVRSIGHMGDTPGSFARPKGAAWDSDGHLYVVDAAFNNVQIFDAEGRLLLAFAEQGKGPGQLWLPLGLCVDRNGRVIIADRYNSRLQLFQYLGARGVDSGEPHTLGENR
jgi:DNA-binding beta-propeller fold protein YncE